MFIEIDTMVGRERCRDLQREAEKARLIRQASAGRQTWRVWVQSWIKRVVGWTQTDHRRPFVIYRSEKTAAL